MQSDVLYQQKMTAALLHPDVELQDVLGLHDVMQRERFDVHRNNVMGTWLDALRSGYPITQQLLGEAYFDAVAQLYVQQSPPTSPVLLEYGRTFPHFLMHFEPLHDFRYVADIADLEWRRRLAFHASDAPVLTLQHLRGLAVEQWLFKHLRWHSSMQLVLSAYPLHRLWLSQTQGEALPDAREWIGENVLVWRPHYEVKQHAVSHEQAQLLLSIHDGQSLAKAIELTGQSLTVMSRQFVQLVQLGCFSEW